MFRLRTAGSLECDFGRGWQRLRPVYARCLGLAPVEAQAPSCLVISFIFKLSDVYAILKSLTNQQERPQDGRNEQHYLQEFYLIR